MIHEETRRKYGPEICAAAGVSPAVTFEAAALDDAETVQRLGACGAEVGLSVLFGHRLAPAVIGLFPSGCFNLQVIAIGSSPTWLTYVAGPRNTNARSSVLRRAKSST